MELEAVAEEVLAAVAVEAAGARRGVADDDPRPGEPALGRDREYLVPRPGRRAPGVVLEPGVGEQAPVIEAEGDSQGEAVGILLVESHIGLGQMREREPESIVLF